MLCELFYRKSSSMWTLSADHWRYWSALTDLTAFARVAACMASHHQQLLTPCPAPPTRNPMLTGSGMPYLSHGWLPRKDYLGNACWTAMFCTVLCSIFPYFLFLYRVKGVVDISPCNTTDVARAGCYFLPFHAPWSWGGESAHRAQIRAVGIQHPAFVCLFFPSSFSLKLFQPSLERNGASLERAASQCEKHSFRERENTWL